MVIVVQLGKLTNNHWIIHLKHVNYTLCKVYLNKIIFLKRTCKCSESRIAGTRSAKFLKWFRNSNGKQGCLYFYFLFPRCVYSTDLWFRVYTLSEIWCPIVRRYHLQADASIVDPKSCCTCIKLVAFGKCNMWQSGSHVHVHMAITSSR